MALDRENAGAKQSWPVNNYDRAIWMVFDNISGGGELKGLLERIAGEDQQAIKILYERVSAKLYGIIIRILGRQDIAEDVLQETFVLIWNRAGSYDPKKAAPITWMATIARNKAIDYKRLKEERFSASAAELHEDLPSALRTPEQEAERSEQLESLMLCLGELSQEQQEMVLLAYLEGWSRKELGEKFQSPVATVKTILRRSLLVLKGCLNDRE